MVVLLTDGKANVGLARSNDDPDAIGPNAIKASSVRLRRLGCILHVILRCYGIPRTMRAFSDTSLILMLYHEVEINH